MRIKRCNRINIRQEFFGYLSACLIWGSVVMILYKRIENQAFINVCVLSSLPIYLYAMYYVAKRTGQWFNPSILFMLSFYLFQNGRFLLMALKVSMDMFYWNFAIEKLLDSVLFSSVSNLAAGMAVMWIFRSSEAIQPTASWLDRYPGKKIANAAWIGFCITAVINVPLKVVSFFKYGLTGGYYAVRAFGEKIPAFFGLITFMFMPFAFLYMVYTGEKSRKNLVTVVALLCSCLEVLNGERTSGMAGILAIMLLRYLQSEDKKILKKYTFRVLELGFLCVIIGPLAYNFRIKADLTEGFQNLGDIIVSFISELGGSAFPLMTMMDIVPSIQPFQFGLQYFCSMIAGFFPASIDFMGLLTPIMERAFIFDDWINAHYSWLNFGIGFSLNSEAYINFGWYGIISIFFICLVIFHNLKFNFQYGMNVHTYQSYKTLILLYLWFTAPRRSSYQIWNAIFWCCVMMKVYLNIYLNFFAKSSAE